MSTEDYIGLFLVGVLMAIPHFVMWLHRVSETPRKTHAQNPTDSDRRETDYSDVPTDDHFDAIERAVPPSRFDNFEEI